MSARASQRGFLLIVAIVLVVVVAAGIAALGGMLASDVKSSTGSLGSAQALYLAESGLEVEQLRWGQNLNWYRSSTDPNPSAAAAQAAGPGSFTVYSNLPATLLRARIFAADTTITVYSTDRFPTSGTLQIEEDLTASGEFVKYTGISGNTFTGVTRGQAQGISPVIPSTAGPHPRSDAVYPVTTLSTVGGLPASCTTPNSFMIAAHPKFLTAGTLDIEGEEIGYAGSSVSGVNMTLTGVTRCLGTIGPVAHAAGQPVTPVLIGGDSADYQVEMVSTGSVGNNVRYARRTTQR